MQPAIACSGDRPFLPPHPRYTSAIELSVTFTHVLTQKLVSHHAQRNLIFLTNNKIPHSALARLGGVLAVCTRVSGWSGSKHMQESTHESKNGWNS